MESKHIITQINVLPRGTLIYDCGADRGTYHWILSKVVVCSTCNRVQLHQIIKVRDLPVHPFLTKD